MDRQSFKDRLKALASDKKKVAGIVVIALVVGGGSYLGLRAKPQAAPEHGSDHGKEHASKDHGDIHGGNHDGHGSGEHASASHGSSGEIPSLSGLIYGSLVSANEKLEAMQVAETENERLRAENAHLRLRVESLRFDCHAKDASNLTQHYEYKLNEETGSRVARTMASIQYRPPMHLLPPQVYTLGVSYFKAHEDEKAAVIFTFLTGLEENRDFKTARNFLMTGVAWYRVDNFELADSYFDRVLKEKDSKENQQAQAQARLWKGLVAEKLGKHPSSQAWLTELVDHHPRSIEARWVNSEARRGVASEP